MKKRIRSNLLCLMVTLLFALGAFLFLYKQDNKYTAALPGGYGYNVLQENLDEVAFLIDGWEYYPGQLLDPEDFSAGVTAETYTYIGKYPNFSAHLSSPYGVATYRILLKRGDTPAEVALYLPELLCAGRVYLNGDLLGEQGSIDPYIPRVMDGVYAFSASGDLELIVQCANYTHYYSGLYYPPAIGSPGAISRMLTLRLMIYGLLCFAPLAVALSNLVQWLLGRDKPTRQMGILSLAFSIQVCYPFLRALGVPMIRPLYALEDVCGAVVLLCCILLAGTLSGLEGRRFHRRFAVPAAATLCVVTVVFPLFILPYVPAFINAYGMLLFLWKLAAGIYLFCLACLSLRTKEILDRYLLCASGFYGLSLSVSVLGANHLEPIFGAWSEEYGGFVLVIGFAALMARRGILLAQENRRLTFHLQEEVDNKTRFMETLLTERRELLANLLHDIKNPLAALRSYAELVRTGNVALDSETAGYLDALTERAGAVEERFGILQDFSRGERGAFQPETICLNQFLHWFYEQNRPDMELTLLHFSLKLPKEELFILGSRERLWTALENLCYNAASYTPPQGHVLLTLEREGAYAAVSVSDTGAGIPPDILPRIFERGYTTRAGGDGLGLAIVRAVAIEHGGTVTAASQPGKGSVFTLRLPINPAP